MYDKFLVHIINMDYHFFFFLNVVDGCQDWESNPDCRGNVSV